MQSVYVCVCVCAHAWVCANWSLHENCGSSTTLPYLSSISWSMFSKTGFSQESFSSDSNSSADNCREREREREAMEHSIVQTNRFVLGIEIILHSQSNSNQKHKSLPILEIFLQLYFLFLFLLWFLIFAV